MAWEFNRTLLELKFILGFIRSGERHQFNRTLLELKFLLSALT